MVPKLQAAGWDSYPHSIAEQRSFTHGRIDVCGSKADQLEQHQIAFFNYFVQESREILSDLLEKYTSDGELKFTLPDVLKVRPISVHGNFNEIGKIGAVDQLRIAVNQLQSLFYSK